MIWREQFGKRLYMKTFLKTSVAVVSLLGLAYLVGLMSAQAQETHRGPHALTVNPELAAEIAVVEQQPTIELSSLPYNGRGLTYFSAQFPYWPPMPCDALTVPVWSLGNGEYLMDEISVNYDALTSLVQTNGTADTASFMRPMGGAGGFSPDYSTLNGPYITLAPTATNGLYLITVWNNQGPANYEIWYTPVLANPSYPWTAIVAGPTG